MHLKQQTKAVIIFIVLVLIWGSAFILIDKSLRGLTSLQVGTLRVIAATFILGPFGLKELASLQKQQWFFVATSGFVGSLLPAILFAVGMSNGINPSTAGVLSALTPGFTAILGMILFNQRLKAIQWVGLTIGFIGAIFLLLSQSKEGFEFNHFGWLIILATFCYALNLVLVQMKLKEVKPIVISSISLISTLPFTSGIFIWSLFQEQNYSQPEFLSSIGYAILLGILATGIALQLFNQLLKISSHIFSSSVTYAIPIMAILWSLIDGKIIPYKTYLICGIIILAIYLIRKSKS